MYALGVYTLLAGMLVVSLLESSVHGYTALLEEPTGVNGGAKEPGMRIRISQSGLNLLRDVGVQQLEQEIKTTTIPDQHGSSKIHHVGHVDYDVTSIHITSFGIPSSSLTPTPAAGGLTLRTSGVYLNIHGNWHYKIPGFIHISDSGSFDASASGISLTVTLRIGVDSSGRPTVSSKTSDCSFHVSGMNIKLHGGASWLYNLFAGKIEGALKDAINDKVCTSILDEVNTDLENELQTIQVVAPLDDVAWIDYSLTESPTFNGSINTAHKGEVYPMGSKTECPLPVPRIPTDTDTSHMIYIWITDYLPNSAGYVLQNIGYLQYNVTPENVPAEDKSYLNTSFFGLNVLIPQIGQKYPNMAMQINLNSTKAPVLTITPSGIQAVLVGDFSPYAILPDKTLAYLFTISVTITADVTANFNKNNITWSLTSFSTDMSTVRSAVGFVFTPALQLLVNTAIKLTLIPALNQQGAIGVPLPQMEGFDFVKPVITQGQGFLKIGTDLSYKP